MKTDLFYGKGKLVIDVPDANFARIYSKVDMPEVDDPLQAVMDSLAAPVASSPLRELAKGKRTACIVVNDVTRPVPNALILGSIIDELRAAGMPDDGIFLLNATGTHRPNLGDEIVELVGAEIAGNLRFENHYCFNDDDHEFIGTTKSGTDAYIDKRYLAADVKILTGLIEPHFMAGYSGGRKALCPGVASIKTIETIHSTRFMESPLAANCVVESNPLHLELLEICEMAGVDFILNVVINDKRGLCGVFSGHYDKAHKTGVAFARQYNEIAVDERVDVVITSSAGYPLDKTYYQTIKGMVGALKLVKKGGTIIIASECSEGMGNDTFTDCLRDYVRIGDIEKYIEHISEPSNFTPDQWQVEKLAEALRHANVTLVTNGLTGDELAVTGVDAARSVEEAIKECLRVYGNGAKIAVVPEGPYVTPT